MTYLWTAESVGPGHPDRLADIIADTILDSFLAADTYSRVACEVLLKNETVVVAGEITSKAIFNDLNLKDIIQKKLLEIGYDYEPKIINLLSCQSTEIAKAVGLEDAVGAGDQGYQTGFASNETPAYMPLVSSIANATIDYHTQFRNSNIWKSIVLPDCKSQITLEMNPNGKPEKIHHLVLSTQHSKDIDIKDLRNLLFSIKDFVETKFNLKVNRFEINPAGTWTVGGPIADCGLTGRKLAINSYGPDCAWGGGNLSGKDPTKTDRSGAYMARYIAKNILATTNAKKVQTQLSYVIGQSDPSSFTVFVDDKPAKKEFLDKIRSSLDLSPKGIVSRFNLKKPIFSKTSQYGHFGIDTYPWEQLDLVF